MMKVLVTGSAGFVGTHLCRALWDRGDYLTELDRKTGADLTAPVDFVRLAVRDDPPDVIVHLASTCSTPGSIRDPMTTFNDTVVTTVRVLEAAREARVPVLLTSSVKARDGMTPYGAAKRMAETWATEISSAFSVPLIINRPGTIYGPGQEGSDESGWVAWFLRARDEGRKVTINGDGQQQRDLLHVSDYVQLIIRQLDEFDRYQGKTWDVGGGKHNVVTVVQMVKHLGLEYEFGPPRYGDAFSYVGQNDVPFWTPRVFWRASGMF